MTRTPRSSMNTKSNKAPIRRIMTTPAKTRTRTPKTRNNTQSSFELSHENRRGYPAKNSQGIRSGFRVRLVASFSRDNNPAPWQCGHLIQRNRQVLDRHGEVRASQFPDRTFEQFDGAPFAG